MNKVTFTVHQLRNYNGNWGTFLNGLKNRERAERERVEGVRHAQQQAYNRRKAHAELEARLEAELQTMKLRVALPMVG